MSDDPILPPVKEKPLTSKRITAALFWSLRSASDLIIPRFTPRGWWECDVWRLTKSGYVDEYEIKLTISDFRADADKEKSRYVVDPETRRWSLIPSKNKHQMLATDEGGPNRFWFVVPESMEDKIDVPEWAGLLITTGNRAWQKKQAPQRHRRKWDGNRTQLLETFYHRYCNHEYGKPDEVEPFIEPLNGCPDCGEKRCPKAADQNAECWICLP